MLWLSNAVEIRSWRMCYGVAKYGMKICADFFGYIGANESWDTLRHGTHEGVHLGAEPTICA